MDDALAVAEPSAPVDAGTEAALLQLADGVVLVDRDVPASVVVLDKVGEVRTLDRRAREAGAVDERRPIRTVRVQLEVPQRVDRGRDVGAGEDEGRERPLAGPAHERLDRGKARVA